MELTDLTIKEAISKIKAKEICAKKLIKAHADKIASSRDLNAFITETTDAAIKQSENSDKKYSDGKAAIMEGIPVGSKDIFCTKDIRTTAGSKILENFIPKYESTVTENLKNNGAVLMGKTNMDEFAMGSSNLSSYYGPVKSPWKRKGDNKDLVPGGSSGGSAAAVAAGLVMGAIGTDTGGSIRQPAAFSGIVGMKPTYGRSSRWGCVAFASSLDHPGVMTRTVEDSAIMLSAIAGYDPKDSTSARLDVPDFAKAFENVNVKGLRVGIPKEFKSDQLSEDMISLWEKAAKWFSDAGAEIKEISLPHTKYGLPAYYIIAPAEASSNLARYDGVRYGLRVEGEDLHDMYKKTRDAGFGAEVKRRILIGTAVLSAGFYDAYYTQAAKIRRLIAHDFNDAFEDVDVLLTPTTPSPAFALDEQLSPIDMYLNDVLTVTCNLAGVPAMSIPAGFASNGLPLGLQIIGNKFNETLLFRVGKFIENMRGFENRPSMINS